MRPRLASALRVVVIAAIAAAPGSARAQDSLTLAGVDGETGARLSRIVESARDRGLPVDPILNKVRFALAVHASVPAARIVAIAEAVAGRLQVARDALAPRPVSNDIVAGEMALSYSVPRAALVTVRAASPDRPVAVPLGVLTQLVTIGVDPKRAAAIVTDLIKRGATSDQLATLGNDVNGDVGRGARADAAVDVRTRGLVAVLSPSAPTNVTTPMSAATHTPTAKKP
jgi:hypothetical protein